MTEQSHRPPPPPLQPDLRITPAETADFGQALATGTRRYNDMVQSVQGNQFLSDQGMGARRQNFHDHYQVAPAREQPYGSERDIRMIKLRQKVSGCLRTLTGARQFCTIRSYLSTAAKHGKHFFDVLVMLTEGHPWLPAIH